MNGESIKKFYESLNPERFEQFDKGLRDSWFTFSNTQTATVIEPLKAETIIETTIPDAGNSYKTTIKFDGEIINEFPNRVPEMNDELWKKHNSKVYDVLQLRKADVLGSIEAWGGFSDEYLKYNPMLSLNILSSYNDILRSTGKRWVLLNCITVLKQKLYTFFRLRKKSKIIFWVENISHIRSDTLLKEAMT
jgi:hypothetical protein